MQDALVAAAPSARRDAAAAAERAGIAVAELRDTPHIEAACALLTRIWGSPQERPVIEPNIVRAFVLSGQQVLGAYEVGHEGSVHHMVGVSIAWLGRDDAGEHLHSHVTGIAPALQGRDAGFALKQHQRAWALDRGIGTVRWTFDPLVRRNAFFNLCKLGAFADRFHVNLYGAMTDATNAGDESDRFEICWRLTDERVAAAAAGAATEPDLAEMRSRGAAEILDEADDGRPVASPVDGPILLVRVPVDVLRVRAEVPALARAWRHAARDALGGAIADGFIATWMTRSGWYVLTRPEGESA